MASWAGLVHSKQPKFPDLLPSVWRSGYARLLRYSVSQPGTSLLGWKVVMIIGAHCWGQSRHQGTSIGVGSVRSVITCSCWGSPKCAILCALFSNIEIYHIQQGGERMEMGGTACECPPWHRPWLKGDPRRFQPTGRDQPKKMLRIFDGPLLCIVMKAYQLHLFLSLANLNIYDSWSIQTQEAEKLN